MKYTIKTLFFASCMISPFMNAMLPSQENAQKVLQSNSVEVPLNLYGDKPSWNHDGTIIAVWNTHVNTPSYKPSDKRNIQLLDVQTGLETTILENAQKGFRDVQFSPSDNTLLAAKNGKEKSTSIWDTKSGKIIHTINEHPLFLRWNPEGTQLAFFKPFLKRKSNDIASGTLSIYNLDGQLQYSVVIEHSHIDWSAKNIIFAKACQSDALYSIDPITRNCSSRPLGSHMGEICSSPTGNKLAFKYSDGYIDEYLALVDSTDFSVRKYPMKGYSATWSHDEKNIANITGGTIQILDVTSGELSKIPAPQNQKHHSCAWSPKNYLLAATIQSSNKLMIYDMSSALEAKDLGSQSNIS